MGSEDKAHLHVVLRGRVQGVNFRHFVMEKATLLGLRGTVGNLPNGMSLEVHAEGPRKGLEALLEHLRRGPQGALVTEVMEERSRFTGDYKDFTSSYP